MSNVIFFYLMGMIVLSLIYNIEIKPKDDIVDQRRGQTIELFRENIKKSKINKVIQSKVKISKRMEIEYDIKRAGFDFSFSEFVLISMFSGVIFALLFGGVLKNIYLGIVFIFMGALVPFQIIGFLKNRRINKMERQIGSFMNMTIKRYVNTKNMHTALEMTARELKGVEPIGEEIERTVVSIELGTPIDEALTELAKRTDNKYMHRFASYYSIAASVGTRQLREELLTDAYNQYEENRQLKRILDEKISGPVKHSKILMATVPVFAAYSAATNDGYIEFMTTTTMGKVGTAGVVVTLIIILWFINKKIGAPLD